ncbi:Sodium/sulfate symporter, putative, partial [Hondaea fermentalgiana]
TGYVGVLTAVYFATFLLSMVLSNNSAAVLMFDIAITAAQNSCADGDDGQSLCVQQMVFTLMLSASSSFSTSYGYQTNMMVLNVGNYVFLDFLRFGFPMQFWQMIFSLIFVYFLEQWYLSLVITLAA